MTCVARKLESFLFQRFLILCVSRDLLETQPLIHSFTQAFHTKNTMGSEVIFDEKLHVEAIRNSLTRDIKAIFEGLKDEVSAAFEDYIPAKDGAYGFLWF